MGRSKHSHIKKGNKLLLAALAEAGWAAAQMHETEKAKLIRHQNKGLRQLCAVGDLIDQMMDKLNAKPLVCPAAEEKQT